MVLANETRRLVGMGGERFVSSLESTAAQTSYPQGPNACEYSDNLYGQEAEDVSCASAGDIPCPAYFV